MTKIQWKKITAAYEKAYAKKVKAQKECAKLKRQLDQKNYREKN